MCETDTHTGTDRATEREGEEDDLLEPEQQRCRNLRAKGDKNCLRKYSQLLVALIFVSVHQKPPLFAKDQTDVKVRMRKVINFGHRSQYLWMEVIAVQVISVADGETINPPLERVICILLSSFQSLEEQCVLCTEVNEGRNCEWQSSTF